MLYWPLATYAPQCFVQCVFKKPKNLKDFWLLDQIGQMLEFLEFTIVVRFFPTVWCCWLLPLLTDCDRKEHEINNPTFGTNNTTIFRTKLLPSHFAYFSIELTARQKRYVVHTKVNFDKEIPTSRKSKKIW